MTVSDPIEQYEAAVTAELLRGNLVHSVLWGSAHGDTSAVNRVKSVVLECLKGHCPALTRDTGFVMLMRSTPNSIADLLADSRELLRLRFEMLEPEFDVFTPSGTPVGPAAGSSRRAFATPASTRGYDDMVNGSSLRASSVKVGSSVKRGSAVNGSANGRHTNGSAHSVQSLPALERHTLDAHSKRTREGPPTTYTFGAAGPIGFSMAKANGAPIPGSPSTPPWPIPAQGGPPSVSDRRHSVSHDAWSSSTSDVANGSHHRASDSSAGAASACAIAARGPRSFCICCGLASNLSGNGHTAKQCHRTTLATKSGSYPCLIKWDQGRQAFVFVADQHCGKVPKSTAICVKYNVASAASPPSNRCLGQCCRAHICSLCGDPHAAYECDKHEYSDLAAQNGSAPSTRQPSPDF